VILVNAPYAKNVPGRKTDVSDAGWLRQLHSYGLLRGSFRPEAEIATLRAYLRQRERLVEYAAAQWPTFTPPLTSTAINSRPNKSSSRQSTTKSRNTWRNAVLLSRRKSAIVLKSGVRRRSSQMTSRLRRVSTSNRRLDRTRFRYP
jgi:hypothetical protein